MNFIFLNNVFLESVIALDYFGFFRCPVSPKLLEHFR